MNVRKSTTGYYCKLNVRGAALSWGAKKQGTVALSSSETEYQSMAAAIQEALYQTTSGGFLHSTKTSNTNWRRQSELYQIVPKPSHSQEE